MTDEDASTADRTWDGLEIATDEPIGASVVVRRRRTSGETEVLILHRAHGGPEFAGDWAWRRLVCDLWVSPAEAMTRILPTSVSREQQRAFAMPVVDLGFRPMTEDDFTAVARWQSAAHVAPWWDARSRDEESVRTRYAARLRGEEPTRMWVVEIDGRAVGYLQDYRVRDHPDYAVKTRDPDAVGFDYVIGEGDLVNRGLGTRMIWEFCRDVLHRDYPDADHLLASPSHRNVRSLRALAKCGFTQGLWIDAVGPPDEPPDTEIVCTLDVRHWLG